MQIIDSSGNIASAATNYTTDATNTTLNIGSWKNSWENVNDYSGWGNYFYPTITIGTGTTYIPPDNMQLELDRLQIERLNKENISLNKEKILLSEKVDEMEKEVKELRERIRKDRMAIKDLEVGE